MDLYAYAQIENLDKIAKENGIDIPRLRGYRLMSEEEPLTKEEIDEMKKDAEVYVAKNLCEAVPFWSSNSMWYEINSRTGMYKDYYLIKELAKEGKTCRNYIGVRWDRIHGKKRKVLKFEIKKYKKRIDEQFAMWNKYAGKENVLYIHSRMGGYNWKSYSEKGELMSQPWFLDRVDDYFDGTYCDFYAKIKSPEEKDSGEEE